MKRLSLQSGGASALLSLSLSLSLGALAEDKPGTSAASAEDRGAARHLLSAGKDAFREGRFEEAAKLFGQAFTRDPSLDAALFNHAYALRRAEKYAEARGAYEQYLERNPDDLDTHYALGRTAQLLGDNDAARRWYAAYVEKETRKERARYVDHAKAQIALLPPPKAPVVVEKPAEEPVPDPAVVVVEKPLEKPAEEPAPKPAVVVVEQPAAKPAEKAAYDAASRFAEAMRLYQKKQYREAAAVFLEVYDNDTKRTKALYRHALALRQAGDLSAARAAYERFLSVEPADPDGVYGLAETERAAGKSERAIGLYERYLEVEKRPSEEKWLARAREYIAVLRASVAAPPTSEAVVAPSAADPAPAETTTDPAAPDVGAPNPPAAPVAAPVYHGPADLHGPMIARRAAVDALVDRARRQLDEGKAEAALEGFSLALAQAPSHARADEGRKAALAALAEAPGEAARPNDDVESLLADGDEKLAKKDSAGALRAFQRAHALSPSSARPHWGLARAYEQAGEASAAKHHYRLYRESAAADRDATKADEAWWKLESL